MTIPNSESKASSTINTGTSMPTFTPITQPPSSAARLTVYDFERRRSSAATYVNELKRVEPESKNEDVAVTKSAIDPPEPQSEQPTLKPDLEAQILPIHTSQSVADNSTKKKKDYEWKDWMAVIKTKWDTDVDQKGCVIPMCFAAFMTGYTSAVAFTACYIWCGFQTGNAAQVFLALARLCQPLNPHTGSPSEFQISDRQALTSLCSFILGTSLGRFGDKWGNNKRKWVVTAGIGMVLMEMVGCLMVRFREQSRYAGPRGNPSWTNAYGFLAIAFISASSGLQGIVAKRLNTHFSTVVVLTTLWVELFNDPKLFKLKSIPSRDHKIYCILSLCMGSFMSRIFVDEMGNVATLGLGVGLRVIMVGGWWFVRDKPEEEIE